MYEKNVYDTFNFDTKSYIKNSAGQTKIFYLGTSQISRALDSPLSENSLATPIL